MELFLYFCAAFCVRTHKRTLVAHEIYNKKINKKNMIDKRILGASKRVLLCAMVMLISLSMSGQSFRHHHNPFEGGDDYHFGYISGSVGYSMLQTSVPNAMPYGKLGGSVGLGYEFRNSGLWVNVGAQFSFHRSQLVIDEYDTRSEADQNPYTGFDTQNHATVFHYKVNQTDEQQWNSIDIPVLVGYYTHGFHVGGGLKMSYAFNPQTRTFGTYNLSATNLHYDVTFENMPDRGYTDYPFDYTKNNRLNVGVSLIGEIGYDLLSSVPTRSRICNVLKLSFYVEYGLNNHLRNRETPEPRVETTADARVAIINPYLNTFANPVRTVPFFTGVKLTYMIGGSRTARVGFHHGCMCYN